MNRRPAEVDSYVFREEKATEAYVLRAKMRS